MAAGSQFSVALWSSTSPASVVLALGMVGFEFCYCFANCLWLSHTLVDSYATF